MSTNKCYYHNMGGEALMIYDEEIEIASAREYKVVKSNEIIQKARFELNVIEQKTIAYVISKIQPEDMEFKEYVFDIKDYCKVCGLNYDNGGNYAYIKSVIKGLADKSMWITLDDGTETLCRWINKVWVNKRSGKAKLRLDDDIQKYLINLSKKFTQYELLCILPMKSQYSFRIYELMKSYAFAKKHVFDINKLKRQLMAENYVNFKDFRVKVLEIAVKEINMYTDLNVTYETIKKGRKVIQVIFYITERKGVERLKAQNRAVNTLHGIDSSNEMEGQMTIFDM